MTAPSALFALIGQARRRTLAGLLFEHLSFAVAIAFGAGILLVLLGTQIFNWYWPVLLFAVALGYGYYRFRQQVPTDYALARLLDERLTLPDTLSSAFHFSAAPAQNQAAGAWLQATAENAARGVDAQAALPFAVRRVTYVAGLIFAAFTGLVAVRYGFSSRLDLSSPMVPGLVDLFGSGNTELAELRKNVPGQSPSPNNPQLPPTPNSAEDPKDQAEAIGEAPKDVLKTIGVPEVDNQGAEPFKGEKGQEESEGPGEGEKGSPGEQKEGGASKEGGSPEGKPDTQKNESPANAKNQSGGENSSMMDKMRDAFQNLMNKMKSQPKGGEQQAKNGKKDGQGEGEGKQGNKEGQKGAQNQQGKPNDQQAQADQASDQQGEGEGKQQTSQGKGGSDSNQPQQNNDPKSGTGQQDGQKDVKLAAQQEALGKLSEIIGKRAEKQSGEVMVEVNSSKSQQLRTAYSQKTGSYSNSGGEIHRDEVPLLYQDYVQHYFEQVRRPAAPAAVPPAAGPPKAK
ncbi:MAG: hypothetical protein K2X03_13065 [Bryobacteraceae bacterium]|nr:hypothetical protein [Bryobacteraceae bacterium]